MKLLMWASETSLCLSLLSLVIVFFTRKRSIAYAGQGFFIFSAISVALLAWRHHLYLVAALFAAFAILWLYKLSTGKIVGHSLL